MDANEPPHTPHQYSLLGIALSRLGEAFGDPSIKGVREFQWSLKTAPFATDIFVLVHGADAQPIVWIFDSNDRGDGVSRSLVEHEDVIGAIVDHIRDRVLKASRVSRKRHEPADEDERDKFED